MLKAEVQSSRLCRPIHNRHTAHLWTGKRHRRHHPTTHWPHRTTATTSSEHSGGQPPPCGSRNCQSPYRGLQLLRHVCREISAVRSGSPTAPSVPARPLICRIQAPNQRRSWSHSVLCGQVRKYCGTWARACRSCQRCKVSRHSHSIGRLYTAGNQFLEGPHRRCGAPSEVSGLHILPHCSRPFHPLAGNCPHPGHHSRHSGTRSTDRLDISLRLPAYHHHRPGTSVRISTFPISG
jgi:hypothetical protein